MRVGELIHGFVVKDIVELKNLEATFYEMEHEKTGAKLGWMKTKDENKTFSITFKTIPEDHTGVFHILEHSVLQGSKKYPIKAPLVELVKGSLNTFLNAMTFPDKTMYPVSSRNAKDFENLMSVYLDAVLHPLLLENEKIFLQEGWHYESEEEGMQPIYNGIVLNEMRGANATVDTLMRHGVQQTLFPGNCYSFVSGGRVDAIVDLTYEQIKATHERFYHPSNSYVFLDGDLDIDSALAMIENAFASYEKKECSFALPFQSGKGLVKESRSYAVDHEEEHQSYLGLAYVTGDFSDVKKSIVTKLLTDYMTDSNESPIKKALISAGYAYDVQTMYMDGVLQHFLMLMIRNIEASQREEIEAIVKRTFEAELEKGFDKDQLDALLCQLELTTRERDYGGYPTGIINAMLVMESWLYGGEATALMEPEVYFKELRAEIADGTFEKYFRELFLENNHCTSVLMNPSLTYLEEANKAEEKRLKEFFDGISAEEKTALWKKQLELKEWQAIPNTEEEIKCLPCIALSDIEEDPIYLPMKVLSDGTLWHQATTKGIQYLRLFIPISDCSDEEISMLSFLTGILGELPLIDMEKTKLDCEKRKNFGYASAYLHMDDLEKKLDAAKLYLTLEVNYLEENEAKAMSLLSRIALDTDYSAVDSIGEYLRQGQESMQQSMITSGHIMALYAAKASISEKARINDLANGPSYLKWIKGAVEEFDANPKAFADKLKNLAIKVMSAEDYLVSMTSQKAEYAYATEVNSLFAKEKENRGMVTNGIKASVAGIAATKDTKLVEDIAENAGNAESKIKGYPIPAPIAFAGQVVNLNQVNEENPGAWHVFTKIASMDYLWNEIRVLGGAYGGGMFANGNMDGSISFYSYRDPSPMHSISCFHGVGQFMREYTKKNPDLTRLIIGAISDSESLYTPSSMGKTADEWYLAGLTDEMRKKRRGEILATKVEDLIKLVDTLEKLAPYMSSAVVANEEVLKEAEKEVKIC